MTSCFMTTQNTFYSSTDAFGTNVVSIEWDFVGDYIVSDVAGNSNLKGLTLIYDNGEEETFELSVLNDETIQLYHQTSATTYTFTGKGFLLLAKGVNGSENVTNNDRKRTIIKRKTVDRKDLK